MRFAPRAAGRLFAGLLFFTPLPGFTEGHIIVYATDSSTVSAPPPGTDAYLNTATVQAIETNNWTMFDTVATGIHTVEVSSAESGYLLRQSPTDPNAANDPTSEYGNPRHIELVQNTNSVSVSFQFDPVVTATAVIRDAWTMERLEGASMEFVVNSGPDIGVVCSKYPWTASYASNWTSKAEGYFPTNTILYLNNYDLTISKTGYQQFTSNNVISNASAGDSIDLGTLFLHPVDSNTNQIADAWEASYFGTGSNVVAGADPDGDGMNNRDEYVAGTNPTNQFSYLWAAPISDANGFELAWYTQSGRTYCISGATNLCTDTWVQVAGPWEATNGVTEMSWAETNLNLSWNSNYRLEVVPCWWTGANHVLVNTNLPYSGGSGTNNWSGGSPPTPGS